MKKNEVKELHNKDLGELRTLLKEARNELGKLRLELATKKLKNIKQLSTQRVKIARLLTIIREKEILNA